MPETNGHIAKRAAADIRKHYPNIYCTAPLGILDHWIPRCNISGYLFVVRVMIYITGFYYSKNLSDIQCIRLCNLVDRSVLQFIKTVRVGKFIGNDELVYIHLEKDPSNISHLRCIY